MVVVAMVVGSGDDGDDYGCDEALLLLADDDYKTNCLLR